MKKSNNSGNTQDMSTDVPFTTICATDIFDNPMDRFDPVTQIAVLWGIDDVLCERPDLTAEQAVAVLKQAKSKHDANEGINWTVLKCHADMLYPA